MDILSKEEDFYVISVIGEDKIGIVSAVTQFLFKRGLNIVDIEQTVIHSQFTMVLLIQPLRSKLCLRLLQTGLNRLAKKLETNIAIAPLHEFKGLRLAETKKPYVLTLLGQDRPGVVAGFSSVLAKHQCNIERIKMITRGEFLAMEIWIDLREVHYLPLRSHLTQMAKKVGMELVAQPESIFKKRKKVIVFDMDSTIVDGEIIEWGNPPNISWVPCTEYIGVRGERGELKHLSTLRKRKQSRFPK